MVEALKSDPNGWFDQPLSHLSSWRAHQCVRAEEQGLATPDALDQLLADIGLTRAALPLILGQDGESPAGLSRMAERLGITSRTLALAGGQGALRRRCQRCDASVPCDSWLETAEAPQAAPDFCLNAAALGRIRALAIAVGLLELF